MHTHGFLGWGCVALLALGCSAPKAASSGGGPRESAPPELEGPGSPGPEGTLEQEFESEFDALAKRRRGAPLPPRDTPNIPALPAPEDPRAGARAEFEARRDAAERLLSAGRLDEAASAIDALSASAEAAGPEAPRRAAELSVRLASAQKDEARLERGSSAWLRACGPASVEACRRKALGAMTPRWLSASARRAAMARVKQVQQHDTCVAKMEAASRSGTPVPGCHGAALAFYRKSRDALMVARVLLGRGLVRAKEPGHPSQGVSLLSSAEKACQEERCLEVRRRALKRMAQLHTRAGDRASAARVALQEMALGASGMPPASRLYARTKEVEAACEALDLQQGAGACRKLEKTMFGRQTFLDFSQRSLDGEGLPAETVKQVNAHFHWLIQECLAQQTARLTPPAYEQYLVRWTVQSDGRVIQMHMDKKSLDNGPLAQCLRQQFAVWRYPRFSGELQHVEQKFAVEARQRRSF